MSSRIITVPNLLTVFRMVLIPVFVSLLFYQRFILALTVFISAGVTDGLDGLLARRFNQKSQLGTILDPIADKLLIAAAFIVLVQISPSLVPAWVAIIVIGREFLVSGLRSIAAAEGFTIEASDLGKFKMVVQIVSVVAVILAHRWREWPVGSYFFPVHWVAFSAIWFMVVLSLYSAFDYFKAFWSKIDRSAVRSRRRAFVLSRRRKNNVGAKNDVPAT